jgi:hypothetical protein
VESDHFVLRAIEAVDRNAPDKASHMIRKSIEEIEVMNAFNIVGHNLII